MTGQATIVQTHTVAPGGADWGWLPLGFVQFNPASGTLVAGVTVGVVGTISGSVSIENLGPTPTRVDVGLLAHVGATEPAIQGVVATPQTSTGAVLRAYDGTTDFAGNSGTILAAVSNTASASATVAPNGTAPVTLVGAGTVDLEVSSGSASQVIGNGNLLVRTNAQTGATVRVEYDAQSSSSGGSSGFGGFSGETFSGSGLTAANPNEVVSVQTLTAPDTTTGWNTILSAAQFDPALGTLEAVSLTITGDINAGFAAENLDTIASLVTLADNATILLTLPGGDGEIGATPSISGSIDLGAFDGTLDFGGPSGYSAAGLTGSENGTWTFSADTNDLAPFIGAGTIDLPLSAFSNSVMNGPGDLEAMVQTMAGATIDVEYIYAPGGNASEPPDQPAITGTEAGQAVSDHGTIAPFAQVAIQDSGVGQTQTVTVQLSQTSTGTSWISNGTLTNLGGGTFDATTGLYTVTGSATAVTAALHRLLFVPAEDEVPVGDSVTTVFTLTDTNSTGASATDGNTSVFATAEPNPPSISGTEAREATTDTTPLAPFSSVAIDDPNTTQTDTVTIIASKPAGGTLTNLGGGQYNAQTGVYTVTGSAATVTQAVDGLVFIPALGEVPTGQTTTESFTIEDNGQQGTASTSTAVTVTGAAGDPAADVLAQDESGQAALLQADGTPQLAYGVVGTNPGTGWFAMAMGAFYTGDTSDILWQYQTGMVAVWQVQGGTVLGSGVIAGSTGADWHIRGTGGFYNDGHTAILWQNDSGLVALWDINGTNIVASGVVSVNPGPAWHIVATGDFYGNGDTDIVWQNDNGLVSVWDMDGTNIVQGGVVGANPGPDWTVKGTGDFYGNGDTDILWQNANGQVSIWDVVGDAVVQGGVVALNAGPIWRTVGTGDFNNDGKTDIVWQDDFGSVSVSEMNGTTISAGIDPAGPVGGRNVVGSGAPMRLISGDTGGTETLTATPTADEFIMTSPAPGWHTIVGFNPVLDTVELNGADFGSFASVQAAITRVSGDTSIALGYGATVILQGVDPASLHASNFVLT